MARMVLRLSARPAFTPDDSPTAIDAAGIQNNQGACSVAASYKPPMLVTRVRLPACAYFPCVRKLSLMGAVAA